MAKRDTLEWTEIHLKILYAIFEGRHSQAKVAENVGITLRTCERILAHPDFKAKLQELRDNFMQSMQDLGIPYVTKEQRIVSLAQMAESARATYEEHILLKEVRPNPKGDITNESFNRDAFESFRGALDDIAKELGQRKQQVEANATLQHQVVFMLPSITEEETGVMPHADSPPDGD